MNLQARADTLAHLMEEKLDIRGTGLEAKLARAGRRLPRHIRAQAGIVVEALTLQSHPRLARRIDPHRVERALRDCESYLSAVDAWARRRAIALDWLAGNAFNLLVLSGLLLALLLWRGLL